MNADVNRREFVKIGAAGAAMAALPGILRAQQAPGLAAGKYYRANETVRVACVGYSDRFRSSLLPALAMLCAGYVLLYLTRTVVPVFLGSLLMMCGYLSGMAVFGAEIRDRIPENRAGQFQGVRIIGQVFIPGLIGPAIGAWVLRNAEEIVNSDGTTSFLPNADIFLAALVILLVLGGVLALLRKRAA